MLGEKKLCEVSLSSIPANGTIEIPVEYLGAQEYDEVTLGFQAGSIPFGVIVLPVIDSADAVNLRFMNITNQTIEFGSSFTVAVTVNRVVAFFEILNDFGSAQPYSFAEGNFNAPGAVAGQFAECAFIPSNTIPNGVVPFCYVDEDGVVVIRLQNVTGNEIAIGERTVRIKVTA